MIEVNVICCGTIKESYLRDAVKEYEKRLSGFCRLSIIETREDSPDSSYAAVSARKGYKIALCIEGEMLSSEQLAKKIGSLAVGGTSEIDLVIGGSDGLSDRIKDICDMRLSFSRMTFPHQLMRVIVLEQIYRAFTIINNRKYHK